MTTQSSEERMKEMSLRDGENAIKADTHLNLF